MIDRYCPAHKCIEPICVECVTRFHSEERTKWEAERDALKAELEKTKDHCEKICMGAPIEGARHWVSQEAYDQLKALAGRMEKGLKEIANYPEMYAVSPGGHMRFIAKSALSEDGGTE